MKVKIKLTVNFYILILNYFFPFFQLYNLVPEYELAEDPTPSDYDVIRQRILKEQELKE